MVDKDELSAEKQEIKDSGSSHAHKNPNKAEAPPKPQPAGNKKPDDEGGGVVQSFGELQQFLKETWQEFRKISWPTRQQVVKETWSVLVLVTALTLAVLAFDFAIARVVFEPLDKFAKKSGGGVGGSQTQTWGPLQAEPGAPVDNPGVPGNALPNSGTTPQSNPSAPSGGTPAQNNGK